MFSWWGEQTPQVLQAVFSGEEVSNKYDLSFFFLSSVSKNEYKNLIKHPSENYCFRACMLVFDSLGGDTTRDSVKTLRQYLSAEHTAKCGSSLAFDESVMPADAPIIPEQNNLTECGLYLLQYIESFFSVSTPCSGHWAIFAIFFVKCFSTFMLAESNNELHSSTDSWTMVWPSWCPR